MKLSSNNTHSEMGGGGADKSSSDPSNNAIVGNVESTVKTDAELVSNPQKSKQRYPGKLFLRNRRDFGNDAGSATDSSFTENELHISTDHSPTVAKHRSRKRDLLNLQSNLSPKYIGYANANSPITVTDSDDKRSTRRRNHAAAHNSSCELQGRDQEIEASAAAASAAAIASPKVVLAATPTHIPNGTYMSPIDKLLIKNGANSPNSTGFEADAEDVAVIQRSRKLKRKLKRGSRSKAKVISKIETAEKAVSEQTVDENQFNMKSNLTIENVRENDMVVKVELLEVETAGVSEVFPPDVELHVKTEGTEDKTSNDKDADIMFALPMATSTEMESVKSPPDLMEAPNNSEQPINSPSAVSIDSAKGSSIANEPDSAWPTYQLGDLYWGKLFTYCYWPCMVCPDELGQIVGNPNPHPQRRSTDSSQGPSVAIQVHVRFFADNGRHNWIKSENLLAFAGLKAFEELREEARIKHGPKSAKYRQMVPNKNKLMVWRQAIDEAQHVGQTNYDQRLQKFFEIHENNVASIKEKRKHSKQTHQDTSDVGSSLYDSTDNLHIKPNALLAAKRYRSSSPMSPAFSPVKNYHDRRAKRRKLSGSTEEHVGTSESQEVKPETLRYENPEFGQLFDAIKEYVLVHREENKVDKVLLAVVHGIWSLKQLQLREMERDILNGDTEPLGSARWGIDRSRGAGTIKRLSNRLKTMVLRRSMTPVVPHSATPSSTHAAAPTPEPVQPERQLAEPSKLKKPTGRPIEEVVDDILQLDRKYLFRGLNREPVCKYCFKPGGDIARCSLACSSWFHAACLAQQQTASKLSTKATNGQKAITAKSQEPQSQLTTSLAVSEEESLPPVHVTGDGVELQKDKKPQVCHECAIGKAEPCCICHEEKPPVNAAADSPQKVIAEGKLLSCNHAMCTNVFHASCCKYWPQASISSSRCPMHVCHTCVSDDPSGKYQQLGNAKLIKCVKCPATYHQDSRCIPAGSRMLTATHLICPRHNISKSDANLNVLWCYICVRGGELVCCETCPIAVHAHCRNIPIKTNENYICEECESGRLPLYGEIVWAKFNNFRWWPAIILPPTEIPSNIQKKPHSLSEFVVRFFGTNDHGWISRRRVYLYIEGDTGDGHKSKSLMSKRYTAGVEEATHFLKILKQKRMEQSIVRLNGNKLHPPPYVKIKANKPVPPVRFVYNEEDAHICNCQPVDEHPCGPESGCLNRMLYHECNPLHCHAGAQCENQLFELRKSPRLEVVYMNDRGFGLVSREPISEGTFVIEYVGEVINHSEFQRRMAQKTNDRDENFYFLGVEKDFIIDAGPKGNLARFMNHSCEPNCATQKWTVNCINRVGLFAIKDIPENTELTFNYLWDDLMNNGKKACYCGAKRCSGEIGGKLKNEESKEPGNPAGKNKQKPLQRSKGIKIHVGGAAKKRVKKSKSVAEPHGAESALTTGPPLEEHVTMD